ncbi:MAG: hypothetical protein ACE15C_16895 [Phycisphaerae bacterium]
MVNCTRFLNAHDNPAGFNCLASFPLYTLASFRMACGLNASGFTRKYRHADGTIHTEYGLLAGLDA